MVGLKDPADPPAEIVTAVEPDTWFGWLFVIRFPLKTRSLTDVPRALNWMPSPREPRNREFWTVALSVTALPVLALLSACRKMPSAPEKPSLPMVVPLTVRRFRVPDVLRTSRFRAAPWS